MSRFSSKQVQVPGMPQSTGGWHILAARPHPEILRLWTMDTLNKTQTCWMAISSSERKSNWKILWSHWRKGPCLAPRSGLWRNLACPQGGAHRCLVSEVHGTYTCLLPPCTIVDAARRTQDLPYWKHLYLGNWFPVKTTHYFTIMALTLITAGRFNRQSVLIWWLRRKKLFPQNMSKYNI